MVVRGSFDGDVGDVLLRFDVICLRVCTNIPGSDAGVRMLRRPSALSCFAAVRF
jgi:hypothetical protein